MEEQPSGGKAIRAIIIDDDELMRRAVTAALLSLDCEIVGEAYDGEEGIALYEQHKPDLVLLDIRMPKMDGIEVLGAMEKIDPDAYVIMMTFLDDEQTIEDSMIGGAKDYLNKNMTPREIVARLQRHVSRLSKVA